MYKKGEGLHLQIDKTGSVTIPKKMLDSVGLKTGDTVSFDKLDENTVVIQKYEEK